MCFFVVGLILSAPRGKFLLRGKGTMPAASRHNTIQLGSQALDKVSDGPAFPDVFLKVNHTKSILRFNIWFLEPACPIKKEGPATGRYSAAGQTGSPFRTIQPERVEIVRKGASKGAGMPLSWPEVGPLRGFFFSSSVIRYARSFRSQSGEYAAAHFAGCVG